MKKFLFLILLSSCSSKQNKNLIQSYNVYVMEDGEEANGFYDDYNEFIKPYFNVKYLKDTIEVSTLMEVNSCGETLGDIRYSNDTLFLITVNNSEILCNSVKFHQFFYKIQNPENKVYMIISEH